MLVPAPALPRDATSNDVLDLFNRMPDLHAVALVERGRPVALVNRRGFIDRFALPYHREVFGKKPCLQFANDAPLMIDNATTFEQLAMLLASHDQRYLADGFVITEHGRYVSFGTGESLAARGDRDAHRGRALRESADVPARQHPDQRAHRPPAPARRRLSCVLRRPEPVRRSTTSTATGRATRC